MKKVAEDLAELALLELLLQLLAGFGKLLYALIELPALFILYGYSLSLVWTWFMVPIFSAPALSVAAAIGVAVTVKLITKGAPKKLEAKPFRERLNETGRIVAFTLGSVGIGYIAKLFM